MRCSAYTSAQAGDCLMHAYVDTLKLRNCRGVAKGNAIKSESEFGTDAFRTSFDSAAGAKSNGSQRLTGREYPFGTDKRTQRSHQPQYAVAAALVQLSSHEFCCWGRSGGKCSKRRPGGVAPKRAVFPLCCRHLDILCG